MVGKGVLLLVDLFDLGEALGCCKVTLPQVSLGCRLFLLTKENRDISLVVDPEAYVDVLLEVVEVTAKEPRVAALEGLEEVRTLTVVVLFHALQHVDVLL